MKKLSLILKCCFWFIFAAGLLVGMGLRAIWGYGGAPWMYLLGDVVMGGTFIFVGGCLVMALSVNPQFVYQLRSKGDKRGAAKPLERIKWFLVAGLLVLFGLLIIIDTAAGI